MSHDEAMTAMQAIARGETVDLPEGIRAFHGQPWV